VGAYMARRMASATGSMCRGALPCTWEPTWPDAWPALREVGVGMPCLECFCVSKHGSARVFGSTSHWFAHVLYQKLRPVRCVRSIIMDPRSRLFYVEAHCSACFIWKTYPRVFVRKLWSRAWFKSNRTYPHICRVDSIDSHVLKSKHIHPHVV